VKPLEFSFYVQDKMEYEDMVINLGLRMDYFDPNTQYPSQLRNPANQLSFPDNPERVSTYPEADPQYQISPRLGISYQLGESALLRFAYGHFFQMPPLYAIYENHSFLIPPNDYSVTLGNAQINAQKTIQYEVGLWQQLMQGMSMEVAVFYRDIYDLLTAKVITTYNQIEYGLYSNKDYGNARGLELKLDYFSGPFSAMMNYTLQFTRGNADNPTFSYTRAGDNKDPVNRLIPMSWDQRHTINVSAGYNTPKFGSTLTAYYNSGTPYTWSPIQESTLSRVNLLPNNDHKPNQITVDLNAYYNLLTYKNMKMRLTLLAFNLLDRLNPVSVNSQTGKAYTAIVRESDLNSHYSNFNDYYDRIQNPAMYAAPRLVKIGLEVMF
jgi:outer membrane receptor protein involved in Fe transport